MCTIQRLDRPAGEDFSQGKFHTNNLSSMFLFASDQGWPFKFNWSGKRDAKMTLLGFECSCICLAIYLNTEHLNNREI